jgi:hypothetical protein
MRLVGLGCMRKYELIGFQDKRRALIGFANAQILRDGTRKVIISSKHMSGVSALPCCYH